MDSLKFDLPEGVTDKFEAAQDKARADAEARQRAGLKAIAQSVGVLVAEKYFGLRQLPDGRWQIKRRPIRPQLMTGASLGVIMRMDQIQQEAVA